MKRGNKIHSWIIPLLLSVTMFFIVNEWFFQISIWKYIILELMFVSSCMFTLWFDKKLK
jgi:energy-coupling factor transporter transmembrane protein EcfT